MKQNVSSSITSTMLSFLYSHTPILCCKLFSWDSQNALTYHWYPSWWAQDEQPMEKPPRRAKIPPLCPEYSPWSSLFNHKCASPPPTQWWTPFHFPIPIFSWPGECLSHSWHSYGTGPSSSRVPPSLPPLGTSLPTLWRSVLLRHLAHFNV